MADVFGAPVSRNTLLRLIASLPDPEAVVPHVVGVDEYARRRGRIYGTVLVDVETRRPVDLLPDREADTLAAWLAKRPGIEVICRDRAVFYAEGSTRGAPQALQAADRWHLWHNLGQAAEKCVYRHRGCLRPAPARLAEPDEAETSPDLPSQPWPTGHRFAERTRAKHATVHALLAAGHSRRSVARQLGMGHSTVLRFAGTATPEALFTGQWQNRRTALDPYKPYLHDRWQDGCILSHALGDSDPLPGPDMDLGQAASGHVKGPATLALPWERLDDDGFERLLYDLLRSIPEHEDVQWLMQTRAPDRGRDLSLDRVLRDGSGGVRTARVILQAKHWRSRSVNAPAVSETATAGKLWSPPQRRRRCHYAPAYRSSAERIGAHPDRRRNLKP